MVSDADGCHASLFKDSRMADPSDKPTGVGAWASKTEGWVWGVEHAKCAAERHDEVSCVTEVGIHMFESVVGSKEWSVMAPNCGPREGHHVG